MHNQVGDQLLRASERPALALSDSKEQEEEESYYSYGRESHELHDEMF